MTSAGTAARVVGWLGLADVAEIGTQAASFPLGVFYPYTADLQRVCACYDAVCERWPDAGPRLLGQRHGELGPLLPDPAETVAAYLAAIATLRSRIAFAPGQAADAVGDAYDAASEALMTTARH